MHIIRTATLSGARQATGPTVIIDSYRAFATAAHLLDAGVEQLIITDGVDEARRIAAGNGAILCGEDNGRRPDDFDLGNSPTEVLAYGDLAGATVVMRTTAGTRCVAAAVRNGAAPVYAASLLVAGATATALAGAESVTLVASGGTPAVPHDEDVLTGDRIAAHLHGRDFDDAALVETVLAGAGTRRLRAASWIQDRDIDRCLEIDRFDFPLSVNDSDGLVTLSRH